MYAETRPGPQIPLLAVAVLLLVLPFAQARADEGDPDLGPPSAQTAAVLKAHEAGDGATLGRLLVDPKTDAWVVAHELCVRGHTAAARAFVRSSREPRFDSLQEYVSTLSRRPPSRVLWLRRGRVARMAKAGRWYDLLADLEKEPVDVSEASVAAVDILYGRGFALTHLDRHAEGTVRLLAAGEKARELGWWAGAIKSLDAGFRSASRATDVDGMLRFKRKLQGVYEQSGDRRMAAHTLADIGSVLGNASKFRDAIQHYRRVLSEFPDALTRRIQLHVYSQIGMAYLNLGRYAEAQSWGHRALYEARRPEGGSRKIEALANGLLGILATAIGEYEEARAYLRAAREIVDARKDLRWGAEIDGNLGTLYMYLGRYEEALDIMRKLVDFYDQYDEPVYRLVARMNIAEIRRRQGKLDLALRRIQAVRKEAEQLGNLEQLLAAYGELATVHRLRGQDQKALHYVEKQLDLARRLGAIDAEVDGLAELASIRLLREEHALALEAAQRGSEMLSFLFDRLPPDQAASARRRTAGVYAAGLEAALALGDLDKACFFIEGGRAGALLTRLQGRSLIRSATVPQALVAEETRTRSEEAAAQRAFRRAQATRKLKASALAKQGYETARSEHKHAVDRILLEASIAADLIHADPATPDELRAALQPDEALVLYERAGTKIVALVLTHAEKGRLVSLGSADAIHRECALLQFGPDRADAQVSPVGLRKLLVEPLGLKASVKRVLLSPVGCLSYQSPALLFPGREAVLVPSATTYVRLRARERAPTGLVLALGDPVYGAPPMGWSKTVAVRGGELRPLPGTRDEAEAVGDFVLLGPNASETKLRKVLSADKRWRCVHLACHGLVNEERPSYSALALTPSQEDDGLLTAYDVSQLDVQADLVVLSACETARGKMAQAEGIVGLMRAFMAAGAPRVLVSLWMVEDEASRELMIEFHRLWNAKDRRKRLNAAAALRAAQAHVRDYAKNNGGKHPEWAHPHYWAAWQLWGPAD